MLSDVEGCDSSSLQPCNRILFNHMYHINWFDGDQYPPDVNPDVCTSDYDENDDELEKYLSDEDESSDDEDEDISDN